ncbi:MAG: T9SS type A sorting domain-containing protein [Bacteroidota bacterium]
MNPIYLPLRGLSQRLLFSVFISFFWLGSVPSIWGQNLLTEQWLKDFYGLDGAMNAYDLGVDDAGTTYTTIRASGGLVDQDDDTLVVGNGGYILLRQDSAGSFLSAEYLLVSRDWINNRPSMHVAPDGRHTFWGTFHDSVDLAPDTTENWVYPSGSRDLLLYQYDSSGQITWLNHFEGKGAENSISVQMDSLDHYYVLCRITDSLDADPGPDEHWLTADSGQAVLCIIKLKPDGSFIWGKSILEAPLGTIGGKQLALGPNQEIYVVGKFLHSVDFDQGPDSTIFNGGSSPDVFFLKLDGEGDFIWAKHIGGNQLFQPTDAVVDADGNLTTLGRMMNNGLDVDPGPDTFQVFFLSQLGGNPFAPRASVLVHQLDTDGNFRWVHQFTGGGEDEGYIAPSDLTIGQCGEIYATGSMLWGIHHVPNRQLSAPHDIMEPLLPQPENHNSNMFLIRFRPEGEIVWKELIGDSGEGMEEHGQAIGVTATGMLFTLQRTDWTDCLVNRYTMPEDTYDSILYVSACQSYLSPSGNHIWDSSGVYLDSVRQCYPFTWRELEIHLTIGEPQDTSLQLLECAPFHLNGQTYYSPGTYTQIIPTQAGCDSTISFDLSILPSSNSYLSDSTCHLYTINGETYHTSGTYVQHLTNSIGCDSTMVLDLTIWPATDYSFTDTICGSYVLNGEPILSSGSYTQLFTNADGCDSVLTAHITLLDSLQTGFTRQGGVLIADDPGLSYQWLVCGPNGPVPFPGATHATFATPGPATYALAVSNGACQDTSACMDWLSIGLPAIFPTTWQVFPNPSDGWVQIQLDQAYPEVEIRVLDLQGKELNQEVAGGRQQVEVALPAEAGVYLLEVRAGEQRGWQKIIRE